MVVTSVLEGYLDPKSKLDVTATIYSGILWPIAILMLILYLVHKLLSYLHTCGAMLSKRNKCIWRNK